MKYLFGQKVHELRKAKGLTLEEVAETIGSSKGYISGIETSRRRPPSDAVVGKMAKILGTNKKTLLRLAHVDKISEDIKQELRSSIIMTSPQLVHNVGETLTTLLSVSGSDSQHKLEPPFPTGCIPIIADEKNLANLTSLGVLWENPQEFVQLNIPGFHISFGLRMSDVSMEHNKGVSFSQGSLVFFAPATRVRPGDSVFLAYRSERGLSTIFRAIREYNRRRIHLVPLNSHYRKEIILPRQLIEKMWKAVACLQTT